MENSDPGFQVVPNSLILAPGQTCLRFAVTNTARRTCHYELFLPDAQHIRLPGPRTFSLAPGITKHVKLTHSPQQCSAVPQVIQVVDSCGRRVYLQVRCQPETAVQARKLEMESELQLERLRVNEERNLQLPVKNVGKENVKVRVRTAVGNLEGHMQVKLEDSQFILLTGCLKTIRFSLKLLKEVEFEFWIVVQCVEESSRSRWEENVRVTGNSLLRSQYVADAHLARIESLSHQLLNGTTATGTFTLVNNYHEACPFRLLEIVEITDYPSYCRRLQEASLRLSVREGAVGARSTKVIEYWIETRPGEDDRSFTSRYSQLQGKDDANAYKLRSSNFFKKNLEMQVRVQFAEDNPTLLKLRVHVVNPAVKITRTPTPTADLYELVNDSALDIPYKFSSSLYFAAATPKGKLVAGSNQLHISWRRDHSKENSEPIKCCIKMEIPNNEIILYQPASRPKTALIRSGSLNHSHSLNKESLRERISMRAPSRPGEVGVRSLKEVGRADFMESAGRLLGGEELEESELHLLQTSQNERGSVVTNAHRTKKIVVFFPERGYLLLQPQHSYLLPADRKSLRFELSGRAFVVSAREMEDKQPYKILRKELLFCFSQAQREFEVTREVEIANRSAEALTVYCLSLDDEYFHSLEEDHKITVMGHSMGQFRVSFFPRGQMRAKESKVARQLQFLVANQREWVSCEGELLGAEVEIDEKSLVFGGCRYSSEEISKQVTLFNRGLSKASFAIEHSELIKVSPRCGSIAEKSKQVLTLSFSAAKLTKNYHETISILIKGSHVLTLPLSVSTQQPDILCVDQLIHFGEGYITQSLTAQITLINRNPYPCSLALNLPPPLSGPATVGFEPGQARKVDLKCVVNEVGEHRVRLPANFIELVGYGAIRGPLQYKLAGRKTLLQLLPENPFANLSFANTHQTRVFRIRNLSPTATSLSLALTPLSMAQLLIVSVEPSHAELEAGQQAQFQLHSIRVDEEMTREDIQNVGYNLSVWLASGELYRSMDFHIALPPPQLELDPKEVYFPLTAVGNWAKAVFRIANRGYKEVLFALRKPANVAFELDCRWEGEGRLTKLRNTVEVSVYFRSKKPTSFGVMLEVEDSFGRKYGLRLLGTASSSPLLNCEKTVASSSRGFSAKDIRSASTPSFPSTSFLDHNDELENVRFINRWLAAVLPDCAKDNESFPLWLRQPRHFLSLLNYLRCDLASSAKEEPSVEGLVEELKRNGYPLYTVQVGKLVEGNQAEWSSLLWMVLSHEVVSEECLKWVNRVCGISIETYEHAFSHHKKILVDLISKLLEPVFKGKLTDWGKLLECLEPAFPVLAKIDNKRQLILLLNLLYHKFSKIDRQKVQTPTLTHQLVLPSDGRERRGYWLLGSSAFDPVPSPNCHGCKYIAEKRLFSCWPQGEGNVTAKLKDDLCLAVWSNGLYDAVRLMEIELTRRAPNLHSVVIECEQKCSQEWKLDFLCEFQSEYFFEFSGGLEFKCKMPDIGVIKAGEVMEFRVIYSPSNLKEHAAVLKISNKYEEHVYSLKGKPLQSNFVEHERPLRVHQGTRHIETFSLAEDPAVCTEQTVYKVTELGQNTDQLKVAEAKTNKKEIIVQVALEFNTVVQNKEIVLQISNEELTFSKNVRLMVSVVPRPTLIQAQIKGVIDRTVVEKIPICNALPTKQNCFISIHRLTKEEWALNSKPHVEGQSAGSERGEWEFKLSQVGKLMLKGREKVHTHLTFQPVTLAETCCQVRIRYELSEHLTVYNFLGLPELPCTDNPLTTICCEAEHPTTHTLRIPNRLRERVTFEVETDLCFVAGAETVAVGSRETGVYQFKVVALHAGEYRGQLLFKSEKFHLAYPLQVSVVSKKKVRKIRVESRVRVTSTIEIELANRSHKEVTYQVLCNSCYIQFAPTLTLAANEERALTLHYTPLFTGTTHAELRLYNEHMQEIMYNLEMVAEPHQEVLHFHCPLAEKKKISICLKNATAVEGRLLEPQLPRELTCHLGADQFPLVLPAYASSVLELIYTPFKLEKTYQYCLSLQTDQIGGYNFQLNFTTAGTKEMPATIVHYDSTVGSSVEKDCQLQFLNCYDQPLQLAISTMGLQLSPTASLRVEGADHFQLKPYDKRRLKCDITISALPQQTEEQPCKQLRVSCGDFEWLFPIEVVRVFTMPTPICITGCSQELARSRISLKHAKGIREWAIAELGGFRELFQLSFISSREVYLETLINRSFDYTGTVIFYDEDMSCAEKYPLNVRIGGKKYEKVWIAANVGEEGRAQIRLKNGRGQFRVQLRNNKMKEFGVSPLEGELSEKGDNCITFHYSPLEYNGVKKAEVTIVSDSGCFNFYLLGKFPPSTRRQS